MRASPVPVQEYVITRLVITYQSFIPFLFWIHNVYNAAHALVRCTCYKLENSRPLLDEILGYTVVQYSKVSDWLAFKNAR